MSSPYIKPVIFIIVIILLFLIVQYFSGKNISVIPNYLNIPITAGTFILFSDSYGIGLEEPENPQLDGQSLILSQNPDKWTIIDKGNINVIVHNEETNIDKTVSIKTVNIVLTKNTSQGITAYGSKIVGTHLILSENYDTWHISPVGQILLVKNGVIDLGIFSIGISGIRLFLASTTDPNGITPFNFQFKN